MAPGRSEGPTPMIKTTDARRLLAGCTAVGAAVVVGLSGAVAAADPGLPGPPTPGYPSMPIPQATAPHAIAGGPAPGPALGPAAQPAAAPMPGVATGPIDSATPPVAPPTPVPASSGTLLDYFAANEVRLEPQQPADFTALKITLPMPPGWTRVPDPNVPDAFVVTADRRTGALYTPNAQVVVYRLVGHFDPKEAITHGFVDSQRLFAWQTTNASLADLGGFPSSVIEGTYRENDMTLNTSRRHVIASSGADNYLVSLAVTTGASRSVGNAPATDAIVNGFRVELPGAAPPAVAPAADPAPLARTGAFG